VSVWWLVVKGSYKRVERVFLVMSLVFLGYIVSAFMAKPDWSHVAREMVRPSFSLAPVYLFSFVAVVGTTISRICRYSSSLRLSRRASRLMTIT